MAPNIKQAGIDPSACTRRRRRCAGRQAAAPHWQLAATSAAAGRGGLQTPASGGARGAGLWRQHVLNSVCAAGAEELQGGKRQRSSAGWGARNQRGGSQKKFPETDEQDSACPLSEDGVRVHPNVECDGCGVHPIRGTRFQSKARPRTGAAAPTDARVL